VDYPYNCGLGACYDKRLFEYKRVENQRVGYEPVGTEASTYRPPLELCGDIGLQYVAAWRELTVAQAKMSLDLIYLQNEHLFLTKQLTMPESFWELITDEGHTLIFPHSRQCMLVHMYWVCDEMSSELCTNSGMNIWKTDAAYNRKLTLCSTKDLCFKNWTLVSKATATTNLRYMRSHNTAIFGSLCQEIQILAADTLLTYLQFTLVKGLVNRLHFIDLAAIDDTFIYVNPDGIVTSETGPHPPDEPNAHLIIRHGKTKFSRSNPKTGIALFNKQLISKPIFNVSQDYVASMFPRRPGVIMKAPHRFRCTLSKGTAVLDLQFNKKGECYLVDNGHHYQKCLPTTNLSVQWWAVPVMAVAPDVFQFGRVEGVSKSKMIIHTDKVNEKIRGLWYIRHANFEYLQRHKN